MRTGGGVVLSIVLIPGRTRWRSWDRWSDCRGGVSARRRRAWPGADAWRADWRYRTSTTRPSAGSLFDRQGPPRHPEHTCRSALAHHVRRIARWGRAGSRRGGRAFFRVPTRTPARRDGLSIKRRFEASRRRLGSPAHRWLPRPQAPRSARERGKSTPKPTKRSRSATSAPTPSRSPRRPASAASARTSTSRPSDRAMKNAASDELSGTRRCETGFVFGRTGASKERFWIS